MDAEDTLRAVLTGDASLEALDEFGLRPLGETGHRVLHVPSDTPIVRVTWADVATGFLRHFLQPTREEWASFAVMSDFALPDDRSPDEEALWETVHDASNGWPIRDDAEDIAGRVLSAQ